MRKIRLDFILNLMLALVIVSGILVAEGRHIASSSEDANKSTNLESSQQLPACIPGWLGRLTNGFTRLHLLFFI